MPTLAAAITLASTLALFPSSAVAPANPEASATQAGARPVPALAQTAAPAAAQPAPAQPGVKPTPAGKEPGPAQAPPLDDIQAQKRTVADLRNVGTALFSWLTDQVDTGIDEEQANPCGEEYAVDKKTGAKSLDLYTIPEISWDELNKLLVPEYLLKLPKDDAWGNPLEYRLNLENITCARAMAIRSAGADGSFDTSIYTVESFEPRHAGEDLVWADGYFIRWPQATQADRKPQQ